MEEIERQRRYYELGETYFWFASHYDFIETVAKPQLKRLSQHGSLKILDAGCGPGNLIARLLPWGEVWGSDASPDALQFCQQHHHVPVKQAVLTDLPFATDSFDCVFAIEVIEHIQEDSRAMQELYRILKPGGLLIVTVPAFMMLWGGHDLLYGHVRRYQKRQLEDLAKTAGFQVMRSRYFKILFFLPLWLLRKIKSRGKTTQQDDFYAVHPLFNRFLRGLINTETPLAMTVNFPIGSSLITLLSKPIS